MFDNILTGQYVDNNSVISKLDARTKLLITILAAVMIFFADRLLSVLAVTACCFVWIILSKIRIQTFLRSIKTVLPLIAFTLILNLLMTKGTVVFTYGILSLTYEGVHNGIITAWRLILLAMTASVLTLCVKPLDLAEGIKKILKPLKIIKIPADDIAVMAGLSIRFIPTLAYDAQRIYDAQRSRCADFESGNIIRRAKRLSAVIVPLMASLLRHSHTLALAMDSRCFKMSERTSLNETKMGKADITAFVISGLIFIFVMITEAI